MFLNAIMLAGICAAVLPIVLHLLGRSRSRRVEWGAMMFLEDSKTSQLHSARIRQWLLLLCRAGLIALLAICLARPIATGGLRSLAESQPLAVALVIDVSPSMAYPETSGTRLDQARRVALSVLSRLRKGDQVAIIRIGAAGDSAESPLTNDLQDAASQINTLAVQTGAASVADGLRRAQKSLESSAGFAHEIYLITDRQESAWHDPIALLPKDSHASAIVVGSSHSENVAIESMDLALPPMVARCASDLLVKVRNYGTESRSDVPLTLSVDGKEVTSSSVSLSPDATQAIRLPITIPDAGPHLVTAQISTTDLPADDTLTRAMDVTEPLRVTIVSGSSKQLLSKRKSGEFASDIDFLELALAPATVTQRAQSDTSKVTVISREAWSDLDLAQVDVLVLASVNSFSPAEVRDIEQFALAGGGVMLLPGAESNAQEWSRALYRDGAGIFPGELQASRAPYDPPDRIVGVDVGSGVFRFGAGRTDPIPNIAAKRHFRLADLVDDAQVLASFQSGEPLLVQRTFGRGRVIVSTLPFDPVGSNIVFSNDFLPMMQSIAHELASATRVDRNILPGSVIQLRLDVPRDRKVTVTRPDGTTVALTLAPDDAGSRLIYRDPTLPGAYVFHVEKSGDVIYSVSSPCVDSDLQAISQAGLREAGNRSNLRILEEDLAQVETLVGSSRQSMELTAPLMIVLLALVAGELFLSQRWGTPQPGDEA